MRGLAAFAAAGLMIIAFRAGAQEDLEKGKSGAQIFATDCAICHKTPQAVIKGGAPGEGFLTPALHDEPGGRGERRRLFARYSTDRGARVAHQQVEIRGQAGP